MCTSESRSPAPGPYTVGSCLREYGSVPPGIDLLVGEVGLLAEPLL